MVFLLQGQSDPLMPGQRKVNLKCQSPMDIFEVRAKCIYEAIGWIRIGSCNVTCSEEEALGGSRAIVLLELVLMSRTSTVSACFSFASVRVTVISCCTGLSVLEMSSVASWKWNYNQPEYMCMQ